MNKEKNIDLGKIITQVRNYKLVLENEFLYNTSIALENRVNSKEFRIVVVGEFSAGKSTFINALLSKDILKHATKETTATITYIHNVKPNDSRIGTCIVYLSNGKEIILESLDLLQEYTTTLTTRNVVDEVKCVRIFVDFLNVDEEVVIVDTPGLNGTADKHRELTIDEIKQAHACIYLFQRRGVSQTDIEFVRYIINYQTTMIFVQNFIDELKVHEDETVENKLSKMKDIVHEQVFKDLNKEIMDYYCAISALKALAGRDKSIRYLYSGDIAEISPERRKKIYDDSNFEGLFNIISKFINHGEFSKKRFIDDCLSVESFLQFVIEDGKEKQGIINSALNKAGIIKNLKDLEQQKQDLSINKTKQLQKLNNLIVSQFSDNKRLILNEIENLLLKIKEQLEFKINGIKNYKEFESKFSSGYFTNELQLLVDKCEETVQQNETQCFQLVYKQVLARLNEYNHSLGQAEEISFITSKVEKNDFESKAKKEEIKKIEFQLDSAKAEMISANEKSKLLEKELKTLERSMSLQENNLNNLEFEKARAEQKLGRRPEEEEYETTEIYYEERSGFGRLFQWAIGKEEKTRRVTHYDDSEGEKWDKRKREIKAYIDKERKIINHEISQLENKKYNLQKEHDKFSQTSQTQTRKMEYYERQIQSKKDELKMYEDRLENEYLALRKSQLLKDIDNYLFNNEKSLVENLKMLVVNDAEKNVKLVQKQTEKEFNNRMKEKNKLLQQLIEGNIHEIKENYEGFSIELEELQRLIERVRGILHEQL